MGSSFCTGKVSPVAAIAAEFKKFTNFDVQDSRNRPALTVIGGQINGKRTPTSRRDDIAATA
jgi:hypothetical protein